MIIGNRSRHRAPILTSLNRFLLGLLTLVIKPRRMECAKIDTHSDFHNEKGISLEGP